MLSKARASAPLLRRCGDRTSLTTCTRLCSTPCAKSKSNASLWLVQTVPEHCEWLGRHQMPQTHHATSVLQRRQRYQQQQQHDRAHEWAPWLPAVPEVAEPATKITKNTPRPSTTEAVPSPSPASLVPETTMQTTECALTDCGCKDQREKVARDAQVLEQARRKQQEQQFAAQAKVVTHTETVVRPHVHTSPLVSLPKTSFHGRVLPSDCIAFSSATGRQLFAKALTATPNYMQIYFPLAEQFITQAEPAYCGLSTLAMCLNALHIDPGRLWKGAWRWFSEELFDCCTSLAVAKEKGIDMAEFICLARCNGVQTEAHMAEDALTLESFRKIVQTSCATSDQIVVLNYSRQALGQTGDGHFSPIGGYHAERDMVLLLDVARFKYPPHWVKLSCVYEAMQRLDPTTKKPRGLVILKESAHVTGPTRIKPEMAA